MISEPFGQPPELSLIPGCRSYRLSRGALRSAHRMSARLSGRAKGTRGSVSVTVNRHEELSDRSAPYADFGHGSLFEAAPGARRFGGTAESPTQFLCMPIEIRKQHGGLHAYFNRREATPSGAASGHAKPPSSGQRPSWRDLGVRCVHAICGWGPRARPTSARVGGQVGTSNPTSRRGSSLPVIDGAGELRSSRPLGTDPARDRAPERARMPA